MEEQIKNLKVMIEDGKKENDEVLVEYLTKALEHIIEKQKEKEKQVVPEQKQEEKSNTISKGNSSLTKFENGNIRLTSDYMNIKVNSNNTSLKTQLESLLVTIGLDEVVTKESELPKSTEKLLNLLVNAKNEKEINDIEKFLQDVAVVGPFGAELSNSLTASVQWAKNNLTTKEDKKEEKNFGAENEIYDINKTISLLDMKMDEILDGNTKDPDDFYDLIGSYKKQITALESTLNIATDPKVKEDIQNRITALQGKIDRLNNYVKSIEEVAQFSFD